MSVNLNNAKSDFDSFMVSRSNEEFFNEMKSVVFNYNHSNPIFVYGPNMTGKTHLIFATISEFKKRGLKTVYTTGEKLVSSICDYCHTKDSKEFNWIRHSDLLVIDNAHYSRFPATQEFVCEIIKGLVSEGTQVIIVTDVSFKYYSVLCKEIEKMPSGKLIKIGKPDLALKKRFIDKSLKDIDMTLPPETKVFIAREHADSLMSAQGALRTVLIKSRIENKEITHNFVVSTLGYRRKKL